MHLNPRHHAELYSSSRLTLNVTRREMVIAGYSPSVRLFEAAACSATIVSDTWPGLETFFIPAGRYWRPRAPMTWLVTSAAMMLQNFGVWGEPHASAC